MRFVVLSALALACRGTPPDHSGLSTDPASSPDQDGDGFAAPEDCNDDDPAIHPGATEVCDGQDNDCNDLVDDEAADARTWYTDADGDGYGDASAPVESCLAPEDATTRTGDCNDADAAWHPGAEESDCADPNDYNCDGSVGWADADADGWAACEECDDGEALVNPGTAETCNGVDDDCDGITDEGDAEDARTWYADEDGDGWGDATRAVQACEAPEAFTDTTGDCDDDDPSAHPGAAEVCDARDTDEDCDGLADDADPDATGQTDWYADADADGYGDPLAGMSACDALPGFVTDGTDCDDGDPGVNPGEAEVCGADGADEDCNGLADDADPGTDPSTRTDWYRDVDGDGYGNALLHRQTCDQPSGYVTGAAGLDCDDQDPAVNPGAIEVCDDDHADEDCDGLADDDDPDTAKATQKAWYADADGDGYGGRTPKLACEQPSGFVTNNDDCDDADPAVSPDGTEVCDPHDADEDCDGAGDDDDPDATGQSTWYVDADGDGYGDALSTVEACDTPAGYAGTAGDCDDAQADVNPGAREVCDAAATDEDCNGLADDDDPGVAPSSLATWYPDQDGDGWGAAAPKTLACAEPSGHVATSGDCDDTQAEVSPDAQEVCDGADTDEDCDGAADDADSSADEATMLTLYADLDGDGFGDPATATGFCDETSGWVTDASDCDDTRASVSPAAPGEDCATTWDDDCDGETNAEDAAACTTWYADEDGDGFGAGAGGCWCAATEALPAADATDCDDTRADTWPGASELCDGADQDCDGTADEGLTLYYADLDGDGYGDAATAGTCDPSTGVADATDCDDADASVHPGATELCNDVDDDCDGDVDDADADAVLDTWYTDADSDGYGDPSSSVQCCEAPDGTTDDATDCDDGDPDVNPGVSEAYGDGVDEDCDGETSPTYDCEGYDVPGDYATLAAAVTALQDSGAVQTICLGAGTFSGCTIGGDLEIVGVSPDDTVVSSLVTVEVASSSSHTASTTLRGIHFAAGVKVTDTGYQTSEVTLADSVVTNSSGHAVTVSRTRYGDPHLTLDGVDASASSSHAALAVTDNAAVSDDPLVVWVLDSWLHDSKYGVYASTGGSKDPDTEIYVYNDTITDNAHGVWLSTSSGDVTWAVVNTVVTGSSGYGIYANTGSSGSFTAGTNALYDNATSTGGDATAGSGSLTADPDLDLAYEPPRPTVTSPLAGAGTPLDEVEADFWDAPRPASPAIGAVEP